MEEPQTPRKVNKIDRDTRADIMNWYGKNKAFVLDPAAPWNIVDLAALVTLEVGEKVTYSNMEGVFEFLGITYPYREKKSVFPPSYIAMVVDHRKSGKAIPTLTEWLEREREANKLLKQAERIVTTTPPKPIELFDEPAYVQKQENRIAILESVFRANMEEIARLREQNKAFENTIDEIKQRQAETERFLMKQRDKTAELELKVEALENMAQAALDDTPQPKPLLDGRNG